MECPHCNYEEHYIDEQGVHINEKGRFYTLEKGLQMKRGEYENQMDVYGCPACHKLFMW